MENHLKVNTHSKYVVSCLFFVGLCYVDCVFVSLVSFSFFVVLCYVDCVFVSLKLCCCCVVLR